MKNLGKKWIALVLVLAFCLTLSGGSGPVYAEEETKVDKDWFVAVFFRNTVETDDDKKPCLNVYKKNAKGELEQIGTSYNKKDDQEIYNAYKALMTSPDAKDLACALSRGDQKDTYFDGKEEFQIKFKNRNDDFEAAQLALFRDFSYFSNSFLPDQEKFYKDTDWERPETRPKMNLTLYKDVRIDKDKDKVSPLRLGEFGQADWTLRSAIPRLNLKTANAHAEKDVQKFLEEGSSGWPYTIKAETKDKDPASLIALSNGTKLTLYSVNLDGEGKTPLIQVAKGEKDTITVKGQDGKETDQTIEKINTLLLLGNVTLKNGKGEKVSGGIEMGRSLVDDKQNTLTIKKDEDTISELLDALKDLADKQENTDLGTKITDEDRKKNLKTMNEKGKIFRDSVFENNRTAASGGAIHIQEKVLANISNAQFTGNKAKEFGGAIQIEKNERVEIKDAKFNENRAGKSGGAISSAADMAMTKIDLVKNMAANNGGGLYLTSDKESAIDQSTFKGNGSTSGGGLWVKKVKIADTLFDGNKAKNWGGAIFKDPLKLDHPQYDDISTDEKTKFTNNSAEPYLYYPEKITDLSADPDSHLTSNPTFTLTSIDGKEVNKNNYTPVNNYDISYGYRLVIYDPNGGEGTVKKTKLESGEDVQLEKSTFTKKGARFIGWNTQADGKGKSFKETDKIKKDEVESLVNKNTDGSLTLYAQWENLENVMGKIPSISKTITGDKPEKRDAFKFRLVADEKQPMPGGSEGKEATLAITGQDENAFEPIEFPPLKDGEKKVYTYRVSEENGKLFGYTYDDHTYKIRFTLTADKDGKAKLDREITRNNIAYTKDTLNFENSFSTSQKTKQEEEKKEEEKKKAAKKTEPTPADAKKIAEEAKKIAEEAKKTAQQANSAAAEAVKVVKVSKKNGKNSNPSTGDPFFIPFLTHFMSRGSAIRPLNK